MDWRLDVRRPLRAADSIAWPQTTDQDREEVPVTAARWIRSRRSLKTTPTRSSVGADEIVLDYSSHRRLMPEAHEIIRCEICDLSHRRTAVRCDGCDHVLGTTPDWDGLRAELPRLKRQMAKGGAAFVAMIALNMALFGGAGYIVLIAPIGWVMDSVLRHRSISQQFRRAPRAPAP